MNSERLEKELALLNTEKSAFESQRWLLENLLRMTGLSLKDQPLYVNQILAQWGAIAKNPGDQEILTQSLQKVLELAVDLVEAEQGSLLLFDENQQVCHSISTRNIPKEEQKEIVEVVLDKGLAGWVIRNKQVALIADTDKDERWLNFPNQPYKVRSVLSIPIFRADKLLSIITLHHHKTDYFQPENIKLIESTAQTIALLIEIVSLRIEKATWNIQRQLLENLVEVARCPEQGSFLKAILQQTLDLASDLTNATKGSMFLINPETGQVVDAIISRQELPAQSRQKLIGKIFDLGLAGWVIKNKKIGLIEDVDLDERWTKIPDDPSQTKSALAVPIIRANQVLGLVTLEHIEPKHFTGEIANLMRSSADQMALVLENLRLYYQVDQYAAALNQELQKGRVMQQDFLPQTIIQLPNWEIDAFLDPAKDLAGDFYDVFELGNYVGLVIADVCDKGVGSAMFMGLMRSLIRIFSGQTHLKGFRVSDGDNQGDTMVIDGTEIDLAQISGLEAIKLTNEYVAQNHWAVSMFATMFFGILNPKNGVLNYINGGHEPLFIIDRSGIKKTLNSTGPMVGIMPNTKFRIEQVQLEPGDILFGYTDGVTDGKNIEGKLFTSDRLINLLETPVESASALLERVKTNLFDYIGKAPQFDDITILTVKRLSK
jgi:sigma-B regulation protein RsbU (phosphoserine phosphatase)